MSDLLTAIVLGILTNPGPFQLSSLSGGNISIYMTPLLIFPTFIVPLSIILHFMSLEKLNHAGIEKTVQNKNSLRSL